MPGRHVYPISSKVMPFITANPSYTNLNNSFRDVWVSYGTIYYLKSMINSDNPKSHIVMNIIMTGK